MSSVYTFVEKFSQFLRDQDLFGDQNLFRFARKKNGSVLVSLLLPNTLSK